MCKLLRHVPKYGRGKNKLERAPFFSYEALINNGKKPALETSYGRLSPEFNPQEGPAPSVPAWQLEGSNQSGENWKFTSRRTAW
jgi:hypothetical protein